MEGSEESSTFLGIPPAGHASKEVKRDHTLILHSLTLIFLWIAFEASRGKYENQKWFCRIPRRLQDNVPMYIFFVGLTTMASAVLLAPFCTDVYREHPCPCHWTEDFARQYTTLSVLGAYRPMRYIILYGFLLTSLLTYTAIFTFARRIWGRLSRMDNHANTNNENGEKKWTTNHILVAIVILSACGVGYFLSGLVIFSRHVDGPLHIIYCAKFMLCDVSMTFHGQWLCERIALQANFFEPTISKKAQQSSRISAGLSLLFIICYAAVFLTKHFFHTFSEGTLALSQYLLIGTLLSWPLCLTQLFRADLSPLGWTDANTMESNNTNDEERKQMMLEMT